MRRINIKFSVQSGINIHSVFVVLFTVIHYAYTCSHYSPLPTNLQNNETISQLFHLVELAYCLQMEKKFNKCIWSIVKVIMEH